MQRAGPACHAPFTSLYLDQRGFARVCAANNAVPLGNLGRSTLREVWHGPVARSLRASFSAGGWGEGCEVCSWQADTTGEDQAFARIYDDLALPDDPQPPWPTHLEFALGNTCNLQCVMCSGEQSSSIRRHREGFAPLPPAYPDRFFDELAEVLPGLERAKFLGGEPFLVREHLRVWQLAVQLGLELPIHVTTNGTIWNDRVEWVLEHLPTSLAISLDGLRPETIAAVRVGADPAALFANLDRFQDYVERRGTYLGLTYCLMTQNWEEFGDFLLFAEERGLDVFVNSVVYPSVMSLYRLPPARLAEVVARLDAQDIHLRPRLRRNLATWDDQRTRLRARLGGGDGHVPRWLLPATERPGVVDVAITPRPGTAAPPDGPDQDDETVLRAWAAGGPLVVFELDGDDRVVGALPDTATFLHLPSDVRNATLDEVSVLLSSFYGRRTVQEVRWQQTDLEDRISRYEAVDRRTELRSRTRPILFADGAAGLRVTMAAKPLPLLVGEPA
jgi:MoaA/NifB/PqqE/SkfB family radical SAM enzyme